MMDANRISTDGATIVAHVSSEGDGRDRWSELTVYHFPNERRRPWLAEAVGRSTIEGERTKRRCIASGSLERALKLFDETDMGVIVSEMAREWAEDNGVSARANVGIPAEEADVLAWLLGVQPGDLSLRAAAKALGTGESNIRQALAAKREIRIPLRALAPFVDRAAFRNAIASRETARG